MANPGVRTPLFMSEKYKKNLEHIKFIAITGAKSISFPDLTVKFQQFSAFKWLQKRAKCDPNGVKMAIFVEKSQ